MLETQILKNINRIEELSPVAVGVTDIGHDMLYRSFRTDSMHGNLELDLEQESITGMFGILVVQFEDDRSYEWLREYADRPDSLKKLLEDEQARRLIAKGLIKQEFRREGRYVNG